MYNRATIVNTAVCRLYLKVADRINPKSSYHKEKPMFFPCFLCITIGGDGCQLNLL